MNQGFWLLSVLVGIEFSFSELVEFLNLRKLRQLAFADPLLRETFLYHRDTGRLRLGRKGLTSSAFLIFVGLGGLQAIDLWARSRFGSTLTTALAFGGILAALSSILELPFSAIDTFLVEQKHGFNRTTWRTFMSDWIKGLMIGAILGGALFISIVWFFEKTGEFAWLWAWVAFITFQTLLTYLAPALLLPLFNRFDPLPQGPLREAVENFSRSQNFPIGEISIADQSKRSTRTNAYFAGFGAHRRLVLFDTLIKQHPISEIMSVVAHEIGHFRRGHIPKSIVLSWGGSLALFFVIGHWMIHSPVLFEAYKLHKSSIYAGLLLSMPILGRCLRFLSLFPNSLSRRFEYEADRYSIQTYRDRDALIQALTRLHADNRAHPAPHWLKVLFDYSHPPLSARINAMRASP